MGQAEAKPLVQILERLQESGGLNDTDIAKLTGVSKKSVSEWRRGEKMPHPKTQLILSDLAYVVLRLGAFYVAKEIRAWIYARHPQLSGQSAMDLVRERRTAEVIAILDRIDADAYI